MFFNNIKLKIDEEYKIIHISRGYKPLCFVDGGILVYKKGKLFLLDIKNFVYQNICSFNFSHINKMICGSRKLVRMLRMEPASAIRINMNQIILSFNGSLYLLDLIDKTLKKIHSFRAGMRNPLGICRIKNIPGFRGMLCYGEYFFNPTKEEVNIFYSEDGKSDWNIIYKFKKGEINHIHSIIPDEYRNRVWILTGDSDEGTGLWFTDDDFKTVNKFLVGSQRYRSCAAYPLPWGIIYATDTPDIANEIVMADMDNNHASIKGIFDLEGSCIYSAVSGENLFFSTAVEPDYKEGKGFVNHLSYKRGKGIKSWYSEIVAGNLSGGFKSIAWFRKDMLPMRLFQFGSVIFPSGENPGAEIIFYGCALKEIDGKLVVLEKVT